jgi:hypothetical protein
MVTAAAGHIAPVAGALLQEFIDIGVILNALRASAASDGTSVRAPSSARAGLRELSFARRILT